MVNYYRYPIIRQEGGGVTYPIISQEGGGRCRRVAFTTNTGKRVTFSAISAKRKRKSQGKRSTKKQRRIVYRRRGRGRQRGKGFLANYLGNELRDVGGQVARTVVSEGADEAQRLVRQGLQFVKNKFMNRRKRTQTPQPPSPISEDEGRYM